MSNFPLAYLLTWHTYDSWLHGDARGSIDSRHNRFGTAFLSANRHRNQFAASRSRQPPLKLDSARRQAVREAIAGVARHRGWEVRALHVRTNHVHLVITAAQPPERVLNDMKVWSTRRMIDAGLLQRGTRPWARHGSTRYLWRATSVEAACRYVRDGQGAPLDECE